MKTVQEPGLSNVNSSAEEADCWLLTREQCGGKQLYCSWFTLSFSCTLSLSFLLCVFTSQLLNRLSVKGDKARNGLRVKQFRNYKQHQTVEASDQDASWTASSLWSYSGHVRLGGDPRAEWGDNTSQPVWVGLRIPQEKLEDVAGENDIWVALLLL